MNATELGQHYRRYLECLNARQLDQFVHETIRYNGAPMSRDLHVYRWADE